MPKKSGRLLEGRTKKLGRRARKKRGELCSTTNLEEIRWSCTVHTRGVQFRACESSHQGALPQPGELPPITHKGSWPSTCATRRVMRVVSWHAIQRKDDLRGGLRRVSRHTQGHLYPTEVTMGRRVVCPRLLSSLDLVDAWYREFPVFMIATPLCQLRESCSDAPHFCAGRLTVNSLPTLHTLYSQLFSVRLCGWPDHHTRCSGPFVSSLAIYDSYRQGVATPRQ